MEAMMGPEETIIKEVEIAEAHSVILELLNGYARMVTRLAGHGIYLGDIESSPDVIRARRVLSGEAGRKHLDKDNRVIALNVQLRASLQALKDARVHGEISIMQHVSNEFFIDVFDVLANS